MNHRDFTFVNWQSKGQVIPGEGVLPEDLGRGVRRASGNPYPIPDQNM